MFLLFLPFCVLVPEPNVRFFFHVGVTLQALVREFNQHLWYTTLLETTPIQIAYVHGRNSINKLLSFTLTVLPVGRNDCVPK